MRLLTAADISDLIALADKMGLSKDLVALSERGAELGKELANIPEDKRAEVLEEMQEKEGMTLMLKFVMAIPKADREVYRLLASLSGKKPDEIKSMPIDKLIDLVMDIVELNKSLDFSRISSLF